MRGIRWTSFLSVFVLLALSCAPKATPDPAPARPDSPILPAPLAPEYATGPSTPRDPLVAQLVTYGLLPWEESLSGAAAGLVLDRDHPDTLEEARWAAVRAGYPYPLVELVTGRVSPGELPKDLVSQLQQLMRPGDQLGLVRGRVQAEDQWLAVIGRPVVTVDPFPRELGLGQHLRVQVPGLASWTLVGPTGWEGHGEMPLDIELSAQGEWWLEVWQESPYPGHEDRRILGLPVYVGVPTPARPPIELPGTQADSPSQAIEIAWDLLDSLRQRYALPMLNEDETLQTLAQLPLQQVLEGSWSRAGGEDRLRGAGFVGGPASQLACRGRTVAGCLDSLVCGADDRAALLNPQLRVAGVAAHVETDGVVLLINLASE